MNKKWIASVASVCLLASSFTTVMAEGMKPGTYTEVTRGMYDGLTVDVERPLTADEQASYYDYTLDTDPQIQRAVSTAQQLTGVTTVGGVNDADIAADSAAASSEAAAQSTASSEAAGEAEASSEAGAEGEQEAASAQ